ncbi:calcium/sodium antiporter [Gemmatimonas aurantiaca]|nr:calcium/sodium antiporter [Gemmatimonas aurantiaca]
MYILELIVGLAFLIAGGHWLITSTGRLALALRVPTLIISLVLLAYGSSSPEIAVSLSAALMGANEIVIGNVIGSNIINIALILGLGALIMPLKAHLDLLKREAPLLLIVTLLMIAALYDGHLSQIEGIIGLSGGIVYTVALIYQAMNERRNSQKTQTHPEEIIGKSNKKNLAKLIGASVVSLAAMIFGANLFVKGAVTLSEMLGASPMVIGITVVAIGTSLPELVTTLMAAAKNEQDIAISNVMGSNIFNILIVLGLTASIAPVTLSESTEGLWIDLAVMSLVTIAFVLMILTGKNTVTKLYGVLLLIFYAAYTAYLIL